MNTPRKHVLAIEIARLYYEEHKTQEEIAAQMGVSRPTISRSLKLAHKIGAVQIRVVDPYFERFELEEALKVRFGLQRAIVVPVTRDSYQLVKRDIGTAAADYLVGIVKPGSVLGVSWGTTLEELVGALRPRKRVDVRVVQLVGSVGCSAEPTHANELARRISELFKGEWYLMPAPAIVASESAREALMKEESIAQVLEMGRKADIALVGIGACDPASVIVRSGYLTAEEIEVMERNGAVGDICCRFFDIEGRPCRHGLDRRAISITLEQLRGIGIRIGVAGGRGKVKAILGALRGGYINSLITDEVTAREVLKFDDQLRGASRIPGG